MSAMYPLFQAYSALIGLVLGSFWNVAIARWPDFRSVVTPRSQCPVCSTPIAWHDNVPLLSWLVLRGKCRHCETPIAATYPLIELLGGLLGWLLFVRVMPSGHELDAAHLATWCVYMVLVGCVVIAAFTDVRHRIIPDEVSIYAVPLALGLVALLDLGFGVMGFPAPGWRGAFLGAAAGGGFLGSMYWGARLITGEHALGIGDVKLITLIGAFVGPAGVLVVLLMGSIMGSVGTLAATAILWRRVYPPFGVGLAAATLVYLLYGPELVPGLLPGLARFLPQ
ncbi:MAG: leader peptidase (prepilin peptidase)/N-methyltransferase [Myxococcota bacterium]|jgi:leader peptidase (prepilin peptidase)/N-methyltransferase